MFELQNRIIIVDNNKGELETLGKSFFENGLGCRTFLYDEAYNLPLKNIRIAFFDINLTAKSVDHKYDNSADLIKHNSAIFNDLANALNLYISKDNGPFVLVFWTANKDVVNAFVEYMQDPDRGFGNTASPILISYIDKVEFMQQESSLLSEKVISIFNNDKIKFLFDFEYQASLAGEKTINKIYEIIPKDKKWGEATILFDNLGKILSKIAASTLGFAHSKENPSRAVYEGLLPILNNELTSIGSNLNWGIILAPLFSASGPDKIVSPDNLIQKKVNSVFHIEKSTANKEVRGSVIVIDKTNQAILDTFNIPDINDWFSKIIAIKEGRDPLKQSILDSSKLIAVEISAACDYSNRKHRINKYILGILTPIIDIEKDVNLKGRIESSYHIAGADFHFADNEFQIWLNLNFVFGTKVEDTRLGETIFVLKKEIMDMIGNKYASHISRIGITSF
jgi:hypothetical protein